MLIGYGKTKNKQPNNETYISGYFCEEFQNLFPQLKGMRFILNFIPEERRKSEKSPGWAVELYCPKEQAQPTAEITDSEIPY